MIAGPCSVESEEQVTGIAKAVKAAGAGMDVYMVTPDKDYGQLIADHIWQYKPGRAGGDDEVVGPFADLLKERLGLDTYAPYSGTIWDLTNNVCIEEKAGIPFTKKTGGDLTTSAKPKTTPFIRLENAGKRLMAIIATSRGLANKDLAKFADQISSLCDKWE